MIIMIDNYGESGLSRTDSMSVRADERHAMEGVAGRSHMEVLVELLS